MISATRSHTTLLHGMTLIELMIVVTIMGILLAIALPNYRNHMLRVHRTEAIRLLLQAAMCQERIFATAGSYDTARCRPVSKQDQYQLTYRSPGIKSTGYVVVAVPKGKQFADPCGSLSLDNNGARSISGDNVNAVKCWNGR